MGASVELEFLYDLVDFAGALGEYLLILCYRLLITDIGEVTGLAGN